jgi:putative membrane protein
MNFFRRSSAIFWVFEKWRGDEHAQARWTEPNAHLRNEGGLDVTQISPTTKLSVGRTVMAADRTLLAWVRTALAMNSFGFTIYKIIQGLQEASTKLPIGLHPARAGMFLIGLGAICIMVGMVQYYMVIREVRRIMPYPHWRYSLVIALLMLFVGIVIFFSIMTGLL